MNAQKKQTPETPLSTAQKHLCIVQLTRTGDILQTYQALRHFKKIHPNIRLSLVVRESFVKSISFLIKDSFDEIFSLKTQSLFNENITSSKESLNSFIKNITQFPVDVLVNLSFTESSKYLCSLIDAKTIVGPYYDKLHNNTIKDRWSQYFFSTVLSTGLNEFNLVDLFKLIVGLDDSQIKEKKSRRVTKKQILIHPFSSKERKMWNSYRWVEVIYHLLKNHSHNIIIVGSKDDKENSEKILRSPVLKDYSKRIFNYVGKSSIKDVYNSLLETELFIGHDSMVGHLAASAQVPSVTVSLGSVRPQETSPYSDIAYVIAPKTSCFPCTPSTKCSYYQCHKDINYQIISSLSSEILKKGIHFNYHKFINKTSDFYLNSIQVYSSKINSFNHYSLNNISDRFSGVELLFRLFYKITFQFLITSKEEIIDFPKISEETLKILENYQDGIQHLYEISEFGKKYSHDILKELAKDIPNIAKIKAFSKKIDEVDRLLHLTSQSFPLLTPAINYNKLQKSNLEGKDLVELSEFSYLTYEESINLSKVLYNLTEQVLKKYTNSKNINLNF